MVVVLDCECNDIHPFVNTIHVVCVLDVETGEVKSYRDKETFLRDSEHWTVVVGHNLCGYDLFALARVWGTDFSIGPDTFCGRPVRFVDTLVLSRYLWPDRPGGHSLSEWGKHLGIEKIEFNDFSQYTEEMRTYCDRDTRICAAIYKELQKELVTT